MKSSKKPGGKAGPSTRRAGVFIRITDHRLTEGARKIAASRRVPIHSIYEAALAAYLSPGAQDQRDAVIGKSINRLTRSVESADFSNKILIAMMRYLVELELSFLPEAATEEEREAIADKGTRRFDRFEQWLTRQLVDRDNLYQRLQTQFVASLDEFEGDSHG